MSHMTLLRAAGTSLLLLLLALPQAPAKAETFVGSNVDSRVLVGIKVADQAVQAMMPAGWTSVPFPAGPLKGTNALFVFIDRELELGPEGKPSSPSSLRAVALAGLGKQNDGDAVRLYLFRIYTTVPENDPYGVARGAEIERNLALSGPANGARDVSDDWRITPSDGGSLNFSMNYTTGTRSFGPGEAFPYSAANPGFSRIYRYDQMVDLVMSTAVGKPIGGAFSLSSTVPELAGLFDGSEETIAIMDVPVYIRKVSLP